MLLIAWGADSFSLTKSGSTKSCAVSLVSRTRFRTPSLRRKRRGRWTSFLTGRGYPFAFPVASALNLTRLRPAASMASSHAFRRPNDRLSVDRRKQFVREAGAGDHEENRKADP